MAEALSAVPFEEQQRRGILIQIQVSKTFNAAPGKVYVQQISPDKHSYPHGLTLLTRRKTIEFVIVCKITHHKYNLQAIYRKIN